MVVFLDGVMGLNFLVDWMLLLGVNRLSGFPPGLGRTAAAAALGGGYAGICLVPGFAFLSGGMWRAVSLSVMSMTAFGLDRTAVRRGVLFVLLSMALGGLAISMDSRHFAELSGCSVGLALLCRLGFGGIPGSRRFVPVEITYGGKTIGLNGMVDTGNTLRDPLTGERVLVADEGVAGELLGLTRPELENGIQTLERRPELRLRLIPCQTVGGNGNLLLCVNCDRVTVGGENLGTLVAFAPVRFGDGAYRALTGG